jgi:hypothetical protein
MLLLMPKVEWNRYLVGRGEIRRMIQRLFDPEIEPTNKLLKYDLEELGTFDLESVCDVTMTTFINGAVKEKW